MPWLWRSASNPAANTILVDVRGVISQYLNKVFNVHGIYIAHNATSSRRYSVETFREGTNETRQMFIVVIPANSPPFVMISENDPIIGAIGAFTGGTYEHFRIRTVDGGEPTVSIGLLLRGSWSFESGYEMYG
jgi:hypothetical protein